MQLKSYTKYIGITFEELMFDLRLLVFQGQMVTKFSEDEDDYSTMDEFADAQKIPDEMLIGMIQATELSEDECERKYTQLTDAYWRILFEV